MLNRLRLNLTLLCVFITSTILFFIALIELNIYEKQMYSSSISTFTSVCNAIAYHVQYESLVKQTWLAQTESENRIIVSIEENGEPLIFKGSYRTPTPRDELFKQAKSLAENKYNFDLLSKPVSSIEVPKIFFSFYDAQNEPYLGFVSLIPSNKTYFTVTVIHHMALQKAEIIKNRVTVFALAALGIGLLIIFSWWFSGRAIAPIEANRQKQVEFISAASHELKAPLAVITSTAWALNDIPSGQQNRFITAITNECRRMARLVDDLLILSSADAKTWSVQTERVEMDTLLIEAVDLFLPIAKEKGLSLALHLPETPVPWVMGDKERLIQVVSILMDNAMAYTPSGGKVNIWLSVQGSSVITKVEDTGMGIPDENKKHIFDRFYRIDESHSKKEHYGLGLSIAKEIIRLHKGQLYVSDTKGGGATFTIKL